MLVFRYISPNNVAINCIVFSICFGNSILNIQNDASITIVASITVAKQQIFVFQRSIELRLR